MKDIQSGEIIMYLMTRVHIHDTQHIYNLHVQAFQIQAEVDQQHNPSC